MARDAETALLTVEAIHGEQTVAVEELGGFGDRGAHNRVVLVPKHEARRGFVACAEQKLVSVRARLKQTARRDRGQGGFENGLLHLLRYSALSGEEGVHRRSLFAVRKLRAVEADGLDPGRQLVLGQCRDVPALQVDRA